MAQATFVKDPILENDAGQDGGDFRSGSPKYQMVPVNGSRKVRIDVSDGPIQVATADETIAGISASENERPSKSISFASSGQFFVVGGKSAGTTTVVAENQQGERQDLFHVRVKSRKNVTYNLVRLSDAIRGDSIQLAGAAAQMEFVKAFYEGVANTVLTQKQAVEMSIQRNLSDKNKVLQLDELRNNKKSIIFEALAENKLKDVNIVYVFAWQLEARKGLFERTGVRLNGECDRNVLGPATSVVFINSFPNTPMSLVLAHETGHHFGLSHTNFQRPAGFLMKGEGMRGFQMIGDDIDLVNRS